MLAGFADAIDALGHSVRLDLGAVDLERWKRIKRASRMAEIGGRALLMASPLTWFPGFGLLAFHFSMEAHLMHSATHGAYPRGLPPKDYETLAVPMHAQTWRVAHGIHHAHPTTLDGDPDTMHALNPLLGGLAIFETWALDYDRFLNEKRAWPKIAKFYAYNYVLFPLLAGVNAPFVIAGTFAATTLRNYIFVAMQTGSSVGMQVSTLHQSAKPATRDERMKRQVETSKNFKVRSPLWRTMMGGLDRHIEHHLWPWMPPERLHALAPKVKALCEKHGVRYQEFDSVWSSLKDSWAYVFSRR